MKNKQLLRSYLSAWLICIIITVAWPCRADITIISPPDKPFIDEVIFQQAEKEVLSGIKDNQIVMFGEKHSYALDNYFVARLLPKLKKLGFEYLALEHERVLSSSSVGITKVFTDYINGKIKRKDMAYWIIKSEKMSMPGWFDLVDAAKNAGMEIVCYDANKEEYRSFNEREKIAFKNLNELIFKKNPSAKVIVYCGLCHANKRPVRDEPYILWEKDHGLADTDKDYKPLGFYLNGLTQGKTLAIAFTRPPGDYKPPFCDLIIDVGPEKSKNSY